jgi:hypothetical protein
MLGCPGRELLGYQGNALLPLGPVPPLILASGGGVGLPKPLLSPYMVGATGFEPVTPSVSENHREPLCYQSFSQVTFNRRQ